MTSKPLVIVTRRLPELVEARMMELFNTRLSTSDSPLDKQQLIAAVKEADILVPTVTDKIDSEIINQASNKLKLIANFGNGIDHIDIDAALKKKIIVTNTPGVLTEDTADMVMSLLLAVPRKIIEGEKLIRSGLWKGWSPTHMMGRRIWGKRLGIIGMGSIGQALARRARGFGLNIHYHNRNRLPDVIEDSLDATFWADLDQMLPKMDILSINCPSTSETYHLLSRERLSSLQTHAYIINTSRGKVIDEEALADLLSQSKIAGAGLDVFEREPSVSEVLLGAPNTVLLPHMGSATVEARIEMGEKVIINIQTLLNGHRPPDRILND
ncbi:MAG: D-glycerate dehydrogenase [Alphaproteobacteria bacterium]